MPNTTDVLSSCIIISQGKGELGFTFVVFMFVFCVSSSRCCEWAAVCLSFIFDYAYLIRLCDVTKPTIWPLPLQSTCKYSNAYNFLVFQPSCGGHCLVSLSSTGLINEEPSCYD